MAGAARPHAVLAGPVARPSDARRLLETWLDLRGLGCRRVPGPRGRRVERQLYGCRASPARGPPRPTSRHHRALGPYLPAGRQPRPRHRLPGRGRALVGSVAERPGHRRHARAHAAGLRRGPSGARDDEERSSRAASSARRTGRAPTSASAASASGRAAGRGRLRAREPRGPLATLGRDRGRRVDGHRRRGRASGRPALRRRIVALLRQRARERADRDPGQPGGGARSRGRSCRGADRHPALRRVAGRVFPARFLCGAEPLRSGQCRSIRSRWFRADPSG